jgi:hypothetical protein
MKVLAPVLIAVLAVGFSGSTALRAAPVAALVNGSAIAAAASADHMAHNVRWCVSGCGWGTWGYSRGWGPGWGYTGVGPGWGYRGWRGRIVRIKRR